MATTSARLLELLSLLQTGRPWSGSELAVRLGVTDRTVRRDVERLRALGYPVDATLGAAGGYRLAAGAAMPPLLLDDEEAVAVAIGLGTAAAQPVAGIEQASLRAVAKLHQVLPARLRQRVAALTGATVTLAAAGDGPPLDPERLAVLAGAITRNERIRFAYRGRDGARGRRHAEPHGLVVAGRRWYLVAFDLDRDDWRTFRADRVEEPRGTGARALARELPAADAATYLRQTLHSTAPTYSALVTLELPAQEAMRRLGGDLAVEPLGPGRCRVRTHADTLDWLALRLLLLGCPFELHEPPELIAHVRAAGVRLLRASGGDAPPP